MDPVAYHLLDFILAAPLKEDWRALIDDNDLTFNIRRNDIAKFF
jgi:hypothetical protein